MHINTIFEICFALKLCENQVVFQIWSWYHKKIAVSKIYIYIYIIIIIIIIIIFIFFEYSTKHFH